MPQTETDILGELVGRKHDLLLQLRDVGQRQMQLIEAGAMTDLLKLLSSKQRLLNGLQGLERQLDPYRHQNPDQRPWRNRADREQCAKLAAHCETLLAEIVAVEQRSESRLQRHRNETAARLEGVQQAALARTAYAERITAEPCQLDLSTES